MRLAVRWLVLVLLAVAVMGCKDGRKDVVPTKIEPPPKDQPQPGVEQDRSGPK